MELGIAPHSHLPSSLRGIFGHNTTELGGPVPPCCYTNLVEDIAPMFLSRTLSRFKPTAKAVQSWMGYLFGEGFIWVPIAFSTLYTALVGILGLVAMVSGSPLLIWLASTTWTWGLLGLVTFLFFAFLLPVVIPSIILLFIELSEFIALCRRREDPLEVGGLYKAITCSDNPFLEPDVLVEVKEVRGEWVKIKVRRGYDQIKYVLTNLGEGEYSLQVAEFRDLFVATGENALLDWGR